MQADLDALETERAIRILGLNDEGLESGNAGMTNGRVLPWLQPMAGQDIWELWDVEYRDVIIVGPDNEYVGTYNLTIHDLSNPDNYEVLKSLLLDAAGK
jgi:hypothetical protein